MCSTRLEEIVERASGDAVFAILDAHSGYEQRKRDPICRDLTAFITSYGLLRKTRSPQGGTKSVADFQRTMIKVLQIPVAKDCVSVYVDDVSIFPDRHSQQGLPGIRKEILSLAVNLDLTLRSAIDDGLTFRGDKTSIAVPEAIIVGHKVCANGRTPSEKNVAKIVKWNKFEDKTDVRGFVQLAGFFRIYVKGFATIAEPLFNLLRKKVKFVWGEKEQEAVEVLKKALVSYPVLSPLDYTAQEERPLILNTDAGPCAGGGFYGKENNWV
jgi:hypothetical protein